MDNLDHGNLFGDVDALWYVLEMMCGISQTVILNGHEVQVRVEIKND
ncbi:MAG: hypothetical protein WCY09_08290 [Candidatus Omnitrophota bacterium]|jgi:hypothetical protein